MTVDPQITITRVNAREALGGHGVPKDKVVSRFNRAIKLIPQLVELCDVLHIYDNTEEPFRIFKKRKEVYYHWCNDFWSFEEIERLSGIKTYSN